MSGSLQQPLSPSVHPKYILYHNTMNSCGNVCLLYYNNQFNKSIEVLCTVLYSKSSEHVIDFALKHFVLSKINFTFARCVPLT